MKTAEQVKEFFILRGYKEFPAPHYETAKPVFAGQKRIEDAKSCECNDRMVCWNVYIHDFMVSEDLPQFQSVAIELFGQVNETWFKLEIYGMSFDEVEEKIDWAEQELKRMWNNIHKD